MQVRNGKSYIRAVRQQRVKAAVDTVLKLFTTNRPGTSAQATGLAAVIAMATTNAGTPDGPIELGLEVSSPKCPLDSVKEIAFIGIDEVDSAESSDTDDSSHFDGSSVTSADSVSLSHQHSLAISSKDLWKDPSTYAVKAIQSPWHTMLFRLQSTLFHQSIKYFQSDLDYRYLLVPLTTGSISSPMGFGSDSMPVSIDLCGQRTYLADSQQFLLEYALRLEDGIPGSYYVGTSCRGEDHDSTHLNQFTHVECELRGGLDESIKVANGYVTSLTRAFLKHHRAEIESCAGTVEHLEALLNLYKKHGNTFPIVTLDEALDFPEITDEMWEYAVPEEPRYGKKITRLGERALISRFGGAVWLTEIDHLSAPFYQAYLEGTAGSTNAKAKAGDLLLGLGEVLGCGERHATLEDTMLALGQHQVDPDEYRWYVDMRAVKPFRSAGWGIGTERFLAWVLQHDDIRDIQLLPRLKGIECAP